MLCLLDHCLLTSSNRNTEANNCTIGTATVERDSTHVKTKPNEVASNMLGHIRIGGEQTSYTYILQHKVDTKTVCIDFYLNSWDLKILSVSSQLFSSIQTAFCYSGLHSCMQILQKLACQWKANGLSPHNA